MAHIVSTIFSGCLGGLLGGLLSGLLKELLVWAVYGRHQADRDLEQTIELQQAIKELEQANNDLTQTNNVLKQANKDFVEPPIEIEDSKL
jgi:cell division protein FtsB